MRPSDWVVLLLLLAAVLGYRGWVRRARREAGRERPAPGAEPARRAAEAERGRGPVRADPDVPREGAPPRPRPSRAASAAGEDPAVALLRRHGFAVVAAGVQACLAVREGDRYRERPVRADYLARRGGRLYAVRVVRRTRSGRRRPPAGAEAGERALDRSPAGGRAGRRPRGRLPDPELALAFRCHGAVVADVERGRLRVLEGAASWSRGGWALLPGRRERVLAAALVLLLLAGAAAAGAWLGRP